MTRSELLDRLSVIKDRAYAKRDDVPDLLRVLEEDIRLDGVLDVQAPREIAESMNLPRPAGALAGNG